MASHDKPLEYFWTRACGRWGQALGDRKMGFKQLGSERVLSCFKTGQTRPTYFNGPKYHFEKIIVSDITRIWVTIIFWVTQICPNLCDPNLGHPNNPNSLDSLEGNWSHLVTLWVELQSSQAVPTCPNSLCKTIKSFKVAKAAVVLRLLAGFFGSGVGGHTRATIGSM